MREPFFVKIDNCLYNIRPEEVTYLESKENYVHIHFRKDNSIIVRSTLTDALNKLPEDMFIKVHRSYAVSVYVMDRIEKYNLVVGKKSIPIGRNQYYNVLKQLTILGE